MRPKLRDQNIGSQKIRDQNIGSQKIRDQNIGSHYMESSIELGLETDH